MREELKPCRRCGGEAIARTRLGGIAGAVEIVGCTKCGADTQPFKTEAEAITAWNTRSNPPQEERSDPLDLAAADDNRPADLAAADAAVARIMAMSDEEIMAEPGAAERAVEAGKVIAYAVALHDIRTVRDKLQAAFDDHDQAPGVRNFSGGLAEHLTDALAALFQPADDNHKALVEEIADKWLAEAADNTRFADQGAKNEAWTRELRDRAITLKDCAHQLRAAFQSRQEEK